VHASAEFQGSLCAREEHGQLQESVFNSTAEVAADAEAPPRSLGESHKLRFMDG